MNRVEAVERAARHLAQYGASWDDRPQENRKYMREQARKVLDASGYPAALTEAIEILRGEDHHSRDFVPGEAECFICGSEWPCRTARFLAEHDETT